MRTIAVELSGGSSPFGWLTPVTLRGYTGEAMEPFISRDGRCLFYNMRNDGPDPQLRFAGRVDDLTSDGTQPISSSPRAMGPAVLGTWASYRQQSSGA